MLKEIKYEYVNVLGVKFKFYKPVIEDLVGRRFDYINVEDNGNTVRLGNDKEEFIFHDYNLTESLGCFVESFNKVINSAQIKTIYNPGFKNKVLTEVIMSWSEQGLDDDWWDNIALSWASDNVKLTYVSKEAK
jgi:hypothetical protein